MNEKYLDFTYTFHKKKKNKQYYYVKFLSFRNKSRKI